MTELENAARFLRERDCFEILTHEYPDGDTLGSGFALCRALRNIGKKARVIFTELPPNYAFLAKDFEEQSFECETVVSVDVADEKLLGRNREAYSGRIELCIDHHEINRVNAPVKCVDPSSASNCEILYRLFRLMELEITPAIADALYTGVSTDTGCFKYSNTTPATLRTAADLLELGADSFFINKLMFDTKTKKRLELERKIYSNLTYCAGGRCAIIAVTRDILDETGAGSVELDGLSSIPRQIEGVSVGITLREKERGVFKISVRSDENVMNAAQFCSRFGGGGHAAAAGCQLDGGEERVREILVGAIEESI